MGDVVTALARAVQDEGHQVVCLVPKYDCLNYDEVQPPACMTLHDARDCRRCFLDALQAGIRKQLTCGLCWVWWLHTTCAPASLLPACCRLLHLSYSSCSGSQPCLTLGVCMQIQSLHQTGEYFWGGAQIKVGCLSLRRSLPLSLSTC